MLAGDGLPEGGTDLVTLGIVSCRLYTEERYQNLRIDRSEGAPVAEKRR